MKIRQNETIESFDLKAVFSYGLCKVRSGRNSCNLCKSLYSINLDTYICLSNDIIFAL